MSHTPGPWVVCETFSTVDKGGDTICRMSGQFSDQELANMRLIAAAPVLLEACEKALQFIQNGIEFGYIRMPDPETPDSALETPGMLRAAIVKAKGEPSP